LKILPLHITLFQELGTLTQEIIYERVTEICEDLVCSVLSMFKKERDLILFILDKQNKKDRRQV